MTLAIVEGSKPAKLSELFGGVQFAADSEAASIESRVSIRDAEELLQAWNEILDEYEQNGGNVASLFSSAATGSGVRESLVGNDGAINPELQSLKDKLFIQTGEDSHDTFTAFEHYRLEWRRQ